MSDQPFKMGQRVRLTTRHPESTLGVTRDPNGTRFLEDVEVAGGDEGTYYCAGPVIADVEQWHIIRVERDFVLNDGSTVNEVFCPVGPDMFEVI